LNNPFSAFFSGEFDFRNNFAVLALPKQNFVFATVRTIQSAMCFRQGKNPKDLFLINGACYFIWIVFQAASQMGPNVAKAIRTKINTTGTIT